MKIRNSKMGSSKVCNLPQICYFATRYERKMIEKFYWWCKYLIIVESTWYRKPNEIILFISNLLQYLVDNDRRRTIDVGYYIEQRWRYACSPGSKNRPSSSLRGSRQEVSQTFGRPPIKTKDFTKKKKDGLTDEVAMRNWHDFSTSNLSKTFGLHPPIRHSVLQS